MTSTRILEENARTDGVADKSYWDVASSAQIEGFATDMSVNAGNQIDFKINLDGGAGRDYKVEIFRLGYYGGSGAREVAEWTNTNGVDQALPLYNAELGMVDAGNWLVTDSWNVPADAVSGVYIARLQMLDGNGNPIAGQTNQIPFIVRNDGVEADIVLQTSDTTWQAYNGWTGGLGTAGGGLNLYGDSANLVDRDPIPGASSNAADRGYAVSYNRPFLTRDGVGAYAGPHDFLYGADYAAIYFLEQQGYDVSYISGVDTDRLGPDYLQNYKAFISVGHDEYWSNAQRSNVEDARDAGVNILFWSGNEVYWKTRWETSTSEDGTEYRTLVCYKETLAVADPNAGPEDYVDLDPTNIWTGTWRDMRFVGATDANGNYISGGLPETVTGMLSECACVETMLTGQLFGPDGTGEFGGALAVPEAFANLRVWRDTNVPATGLAPGIIGYEWDISPTDETRPAGLIKLSETTLSWSGILLDQGMTTAPGVATHNLSLYRAESGALVFGAGTVFWSWGLSDQHDNTPYAANIESRELQQFTVNMFADMGIQPAVSNSILASQGLVRATASSDFVAATTTISDLQDTISAHQTVTITGTAADFNGTASTSDDGKVAAVEVSVDGGVTWRVANGTTNWSFSWTPSAEGVYTIKARAIDDSLNMTNMTVAQDTVTVTAPVVPSVVSLFGSAPATGTTMYNDNVQVELGMKFVASQAGSVSGLRYYRDVNDANDTDVRQGHLWSSTGALLGTVTFTSVAGQSGWQVANFSSPITLVAGQEYTVSYRTENNYVSSTGFFAASREVAFDGLDNDAFSDSFGIINAPISAGVFAYGSSVTRPTESWNAANYFVDVLFQPAGATNTAPTITSGNFSVAENGQTVGAVTATDAENNPITYAIAGGVDAAKFTINATTGALFFLTSPNYEAPTDVGGNNVYDIIVSASDGFVATTKAVTVTVTDQQETGNTAPTITSGNYTIAENATAVGFVTATDAQSNPITYAISGGADAAKFTINASTGALAFIAPPNYEAPTDVGANNVYDLVVTASDGIAAPTAKAVTVTVTNVAESTTLLASSVTPAAFESGATDVNNYELGTKFVAAQAGQITALQYYRGAADADDTDVRTLSLWNSSGVKIGSVTVTSAAGATGWQAGTLSSPISIVAGETYTVSYSYVFNNGQGAVESYANTGSYYTVARPSADGLLTSPVNAGVYAVGTGLFPTASWNAANYFVDVQFQAGAANTAPTITSGNYTVAENATAVGSVTATDAQSNPITYAIAGGADAAKFTINATTGALSFITAPDYETPTDVGANNVYDIIVSASDGIAPATTKAVTVTVTDVAENTAPVIISGNYTVPENSTAVGSVTATDAQNNTITYAIAGGADASKFTINASTGALSFISAPNYEAPTDVGANNVYDIIVSASDGIAPATTKAVTVTVTDVAENTAPTITTTNISVAENSVVAGNVVATDAQSNPITYAIAGGADAAKFTINATTGQLQFVTRPNYEAPHDVGANNVYDLIVSASDGIAPATTKAITVTVTNVSDVTELLNSAPSITSANYTVAENSTTAGTVTATDANGNVITYGISGGVDAARFTIDRLTGVLSFVTPPDYEAPVDSGANNVYNITVSATDNMATTTKAITITVTNVNDTANTAPVITSGNYTVPENGTAVGSVTATDAQGNPITYAIAGGADAARFTINAATGALSFVAAPNYEAPTDVGGNNVYDIIVSASDGIAAATTKAVTITVTDVVENTAPVITSGNYTVAENGTAVGAVAATDAESNAITYAIAGGVDASKFTINATTGALSFISAPNYEAPTDVGANNVYDIIVSASDGIAAATTKAVTVTVTDVAEVVNTAPTITSGNYTIAENTTAVGAVTATDAQNNTITYAIAGGADASKFTINASTGALSFISAPNYEAPTDVGANNIYDIIVSASDGIAAATTKAVTVTVTDVAEAQSRLFASNVTPAAFESGTTDAVNYELGTRFTASQAGQITALQYYRGAADADDTDVRALSLWNSSGVKIGTVTVTSAAGATGWQVGTLSSPISIVAGQTYTVSYSYVFNNGQGAVESYANTSSYHTTTRSSADGLLTAPVNAGVYVEGTGLFPSSSWNASSYFVDVLFTPQSAAAPIILDLAGDGLNLSSNVSFDFDDDGVLELGNWAGVGDAFLALDRNGDGVINGISEISFVSDLPGATTDLEGLKAFDSNSDGILSVDDDAFGDFLVWEDADQDGVSQASELRTLAESSIHVIDLTAAGESYTDTQGNVVHGSVDVVLASGGRIAAFDVELNYGEPAAIADTAADTITTQPNSVEVVSPEPRVLSDAWLSALLAKLDHFASTAEHALNPGGDDFVDVHTDAYSIGLHPALFELMTNYADSLI